MKQFLIKITLFITCSILFYIVALPIWKNVLPKEFSPNIYYKLGGYGHMYTRLKEAKETDSVDILFLGSSHTYRGFDPRVFKEKGYKTFNLGSSAQSPIQTHVLLKRYLDKIKPKQIIYEVYPATLASNGVESSLDIVSNDKNDLYSLIMALKINHIKTWNTLIYAWYRDLFNVNKDFKENPVKWKDLYIKGGYVQKEVSYFKPPKKWDSKEITINKMQLKYFNEIIKDIKKRNIDLLLVYAPIPSENYNRYKNNKYFDSLMSTYAKYYNFNKIVKLNDTLHFFDSHHLNQNGVKIFNEKLLQILRK